MSYQQTFNVRFWLKKSITRKDGTIPIYARISVNSIVSDLSTQLAVKKSHWCIKAARVKLKYKEAGETNPILEKILAKLHDALDQLNQEGRPVTALSIKDRYLGIDKPVLSLLELIDYHKENEFQKLASGTVKNYAATETYLKRFLKEEYKTIDVPLLQIDYSFIIKFENFLIKCKPIKSSQPLSNNGRMKHLERFKKLTTLALKHNWIKLNPFALYKMSYDHYDCAYLQAAEIRKMKSILLDDQLSVTRDLFIFSCYTGLSYVEIKNLRLSHITEGIDGNLWIMLRRQKSKTAVKLPILPDAQEILDKYLSEHYGNESTPIIPILSNQKTNQYLKLIAKKCDIQKNLTFHVARHTFATTITLLNEVPIETVSKMLGHTKLSTTQKYARVVEEKISLDMGKLSKRLGKNVSKRSRSKQPIQLKIVR